MLRLMIGSDIHRRLDHLKEALDDARSEGALDAILLAGDFETAQEDIDRLDIPESLYLVHGNNDALLAPSDPADELVIDIEDNRISGVHAAGYTDPLPPRPASSVHRILMTHGHRYHAPRLLALRARALEAGADIVVYGHTHRYQEDAGRPGDALILNPGTLMPAPGSGRCTYMILEIAGSKVRPLRHEP